jgi:hypothetical protein
MYALVWHTPSTVTVENVESVVDPVTGFIVSHRLPLEAGPGAYDTFDRRVDGDVDDSSRSTQRNAN